jgi:hypothetical protein
VGLVLLSICNCISIRAFFLAIFSFLLSSFDISFRPAAAAIAVAALERAEPDRDPLAGCSAATWLLGIGGGAAPPLSRALLLSKRSPAFGGALGARTKTEPATELPQLVLAVFRERSLPSGVAGFARFGG